MLLLVVENLAQGPLHEPAPLREHLYGFGFGTRYGNPSKATRRTHEVYQWILTG